MNQCTAEGDATLPRRYARREPNQKSAFKDVYDVMTLNMSEKYELKLITISNISQNLSFPPS